MRGQACISQKMHTGHQGLMYTRHFQGSMRAFVECMAPGGSRDTESTYLRVERCMRGERAYMRLSCRGSPVVCVLAWRLTTSPDR